MEAGSLSALFASFSIEWYSLRRAGRERNVGGKQSMRNREAEVREELKIEPSQRLEGV